MCKDGSAASLLSSICHSVLCCSAAGFSKVIHTVPAQASPQRRSQVLASWLQADCPVFSEGEDQHSVLQAAALATKWWEPARDALDTMVLDAAQLHELEGFQHTDFVPFDPAVKVQSLPRLPISQHIVV